LNSTGKDRRPLLPIFVALSDRKSSAAEFEPVGTHPEYRRRGLARAMLLHGMHRARAAGSTQMTVACLGRQKCRVSGRVSGVAVA
jgi:GNAT superfamily N-acetyltransferase